MAKTKKTNNDLQQQKNYTENYRLSEADLTKTWEWILVLEAVVLLLNDTKII
jgi:hypothetical protein